MITINSRKEGRAIIALKAEILGKINNGSNVNKLSKEYKIPYATLDDYVYLWINGIRRRRGSNTYIKSEKIRKFCMDCIEWENCKGEISKRCKYVKEMEENEIKKKRKISKKIIKKRRRVTPDIRKKHKVKINMGNDKNLVDWLLKDLGGEVS